MKNVILILGGARSGKSSFAVSSAKKQCRHVAYVATAPVCDEEMKQRVKLHKKSRPKGWLTLEVPGALSPALKNIPKKCDGVIIECIATYASNLLIADLTDAAIIKDMKESLLYLRKVGKKVFIVSNEVGSGVVPDMPLGRRFRDVVGMIDQIIAKAADEAYLITAGLPLKLK